MPEENNENTLPVDYREFEEPLSKYIRRIEIAEEELKDKGNEHPGIITSDQLRIPPLTTEPVERRQIGWRVYQHHMFYIVRVAPGTTVEPHSHGEDIFRLLMKGSLRVNGIEIKENDWFAVLAGTKYEIETQHGYTAFTGYSKVCYAPHQPEDSVTSS